MLGHISQSIRNNNISQCQFKLTKVCIPQIVRPSACLTTRSFSQPVTRARTQTHKSACIHFMQTKLKNICSQKYSLSLINNDLHLIKPSQPIRELKYQICRFVYEISIIFSVLYCLFIICSVVVRGNSFGTETNRWIQRYGIEDIRRIQITTQTHNIRAKRITNNEKLVAHNQQIVAKTIINQIRPIEREREICIFWRFVSWIPWWR